MAMTDVNGNPDFGSPKTSITKSQRHRVTHSKAGIRIGRPPAKFDSDKASAFLQEVASGKSIRKTCEMDEMPTIHTVMSWERENPVFAEQYARARDERGMAFGERIIDLVEDVIEAKIQVDAARVAIDALKWTAARLAPKVYGDKQAIDLNHNVNIAVEYAGQLMKLAHRGEEAKVIESVSYTRNDKPKE
jgi:hypothetical protein